MKITIIIPAYNEAEGISITASKLAPVLDKLRQRYELEVIFINDGSKDDTAQLLTESFGSLSDARIISHEHNKGLGAALRTGFDHATGDIIVTTDFDGTYDFGNIETLIEQLLRDGVDIVTASPYHPKGEVEGVPRYRLLFSQGASLLYRLLVNWRIHTWTALFRAYRQTVIKNITFESDGFLAGTELLVYALRAGYRVSEFPTVLRTRQFGQSSLKIAKVTMTHFRFLARIPFLRTTSLHSAPSSSPQS